MQNPRPASVAFHRFAIATVAMTVLLIWMGAAVTTKQAGMAFADWPLSAGSINPEGWLSILPYFLEHGHRLIASTVGFMTLALFAWSFIRGPRQLVELIVVVVWLAVVVYLMTKAGAEREEASRKVAWWWAAGSAGAFVIVWLVWSWMRRGWSLVCRLSALALVAVVAQAILGGIRVTEVSDLHAVMHACLAQAFFCLLLLIAMVTANKRTMSPPVSGALRGLPVLLCAAVSGQLVFGALMRHFHRDGLADTGIVTTQGAFIPDFSEPIIAVMFLHKYWGVLVMVVGVAAAVHAMRTLPGGDVLRRRLVIVAGLLLGQIVLGVAVIATVKSFWITNFHVINGLAILGMAFAAAVRAISSGASESLPAAQP